MNDVLKDKTVQVIKIHYKINCTKTCKKFRKISSAYFKQKDPVAYYLVGFQDPLGAASSLLC